MLDAVEINKAKAKTKAKAKKKTPAAPATSTTAPGEQGEKRELCYFHSHLDYTCKFGKECPRDHSKLFTKAELETMAPPSRSNSPYRAASPGVKGQDKGGKGESKCKGQLTNPIVPKHYCGKYLAGNCNGPDCMNPHIEHNVVDIMKAAWNKQKAAGIGHGKGQKAKG